MPTDAEPTTAGRTPGPWKIDEAPEQPLAIIENSEDGCGICCLDPEFLPKDQSTETLANALLIAAAPDMLAALEEIYTAYDYCRRQGGDILSSCSWMSVEKAIDKAKKDV